AGAPAGHPAGAGRARGGLACRDAAGRSAAEAAAEKGEVFDREGCLVWLNEGALIPVSRSVLRQIITKHNVTRRLVNRDGNWVCEFIPFVPTDAALKFLLNAERRQDGSLLARAPPASPGPGSS